MFQVDHRGDPRLGELRDPAVVDLTDGHGIQVVMLLPTAAPHNDESGFLQHRKVLHHAKSSHVGERTGQRSQREPVVGEQSIEQAATSSVSQRPEHHVIVHVKDNR
jgi:hypothetical protein